MNSLDNLLTHAADEARHVVGDVPDRPVDEVGVRGRRRVAMAGGAAALAITLAVAGTAVIASSPGSDDAASDVSPTSTTQATTTTVVVSTTVDNDVPSDDHINFSQDLGPAPSFDTSALGEEMVPEIDTDLSLVFTGPLADETDVESEDTDILNLGSIAGRTGVVFSVAQPNTLFDPADGTVICLATVATNEPVVTGWACDAPGSGFHAISEYSERTPGTTHIVAASSMVDDVSIVHVELDDGTSYWQRARGGGAIFAFEGVDPDQGATVTSYHKSGDILSTLRASISGGRFVDPEALDPIAPAAHWDDALVAMGAEKASDDDLMELGVVRPEEITNGFVVSGSGYVLDAMSQTSPVEAEAAIVLYSGYSTAEPGSLYRCISRSVTVGGYGPAGGGGRCMPDNNPDLITTTLGFGIGGHGVPPQGLNHWYVWGLPSEAATVDFHMSDGSTYRVDATPHRTAHLIWSGASSISSIDFEGATQQQRDEIALFLPNDS